MYDSPEDAFQNLDPRKSESPAREALSLSIKKLIVKFLFLFLNIETLELWGGSGGDSRLSELCQFSISVLS